MNVSESALRSRINRRLSRDQERLIKPREGSSSALEYGPFYIVDGRNIMRAWCCDLEQLGRELGLLQPSEQMA